MYTMKKTRKVKINWAAFLKPEKVAPARDRAEVVAATVRLPRVNGLGVYVGGGFILTAAHCVNYRVEGAMALGDPFLEKVKTSMGELVAAVAAVEPVSDIAVLGPPDNQMLFNEAQEYDEFCEQTKPVALCSRRKSFTGKIPVHILSPSMKWIAGTTNIIRPCRPTAFVEAESEVESGASGGPIIDNAAALVGLTSIFSVPAKPGGANDGPAPRPRFALPFWAYQDISAAVSSKSP